jgi:hypothetical protein
MKKKRVVWLKGKGKATKKGKSVFKKLFAVGVVLALVAFYAVPGLAGSFSNYLELEILDHVFGKGSYTPPTIYVGLSTADPTESGSGIAEPSGNAYARVATTGATWTTASGGAISNAADITFPEATGSWGTITHFFLSDAATNGNVLAYGALGTSKAIGSGDTAKFATGDLDVTLD